MQEVTLSAQTRNREKIGSSRARRLRRAGTVPGVVYGLADPAIPVAVDGNEIQRALAAGANTLINIELDDGDAQLTIAREVQRHPIKGEVLHVDFVRIRADEVVEADVPVHLLGEPEGAKEGGVLEHVLYDVTVSAKPRDIPDYLEIDVGDLIIGEQKRVGDLVAPPGVELLTEPERVVANVVVPATLEEEPGAELSPEEVEELEGLSEEELEELAELAAEMEPEEGEEGEGEEGEAAEGGDESGGDDSGGED